MERATILRTLTALVEPLATVIPGDSEVVLHDLRLLPNSIVAVAGTLTGREVGGPATNLLLQAAASGNFVSRHGYLSKHSDGRDLRSSTTIFRDSLDVPVAALCINGDITSWRMIANLALSMIPAPTATVASTKSPADDGEQFVRNVDELAQHLLTRAIRAQGIPTDLMHKRHKLAVVHDLKKRGFFTLREAAELAAEALGVSRFTIYNYLNEIGTEPDNAASNTEIEAR
ncbi:transcriptional regulator [Nonomuraea basaltis]|nr:transcriptional regulator [Nonomuraea basaltis]